ncbi:uncharacterized protein TEOVI_000730400 [Trypanosoma equiperdum]|uniref:Uncharacterized protein n=1 Tax=Trypanosoma equiperdum TaxID=5694 RepID=A0A1G4IKS9_TRYEQ|nr:hypothetical protein TEOVI_000730400 [Trypanosoma equiperdum]
MFDLIEPFIGGLHSDRLAPLFALDFVCTDSLSAKPAPFPWDPTSPGRAVASRLYGILVAATGDLVATESATPPLFETLSLFLVKDFDCSPTFAPRWCSEGPPDSRNVALEPCEMGGRRLAFGEAPPDFVELPPFKPLPWEADPPFVWLCHAAGLDSDVFEFTPGAVAAAAAALGG